MGIRVAPSRFCIVLCGLLQQLAAHPAHAAEWSMEPTVGFSANYNDNITLTAAPHPTVWGLQLSPAVQFSGETETLKVTGGLRLGFVRYYGEEGLDHNDYYFTSRTSYKAGERDVLGLNLAANSDPTLVTELETTGVVVAYRQRTQLTANPSWSRSLTETTAVTASYTYTGVNYADTTGTSLIDYSDQTGSLGLQTILDEKNRASVAAYYDRYQTSPASFLANTYGIQAGIDHYFSETLHGTLVAGVRKTQSTTTAQALVCDGPILFGICFGNLITLTSVNDQSSTGWTFNAGLEKRWGETTTVSGRLSREIYPTGNGQLVQTSRVQLAWTEQWSPTVTAYVTASAYQSVYVGGTVTGSNSNYYRIEPRLSWHITDEWVLSALYSYSRVKYESATSASANAAYLTLSYAWPKMSVSR
jgi:hypothetical protein